MKSPINTSQASRDKIRVNKIKHTEKLENSELKLKLFLEFYKYFSHFFTRVHDHVLKMTVVMGDEQRPIEHEDSKKALRLKLGSLIVEADFCHGYCFRANLKTEVED